MIRYPWDTTLMAAAISTLDSKWFTKATRRTTTLVRKGLYQEASTIWSTVKPAFMSLQHNKCVYCERQYEDALYGAIELDLDHFRPKSGVQSWPDSNRHPGVFYAQSLGSASPTGYYWLAYELQNYAVSCKICNSRFKLNFFPILNARAQTLLPVSGMQMEGALLCYPLGTLDEDPEQLITFSLTTAVPRQADGVNNLRGRVIIDFFGLNKRDHLHKERARMIGAVSTLLEARDQQQATPDMLATLHRMSEPHIPHAACVRAFMNLWRDSQEIAKEGGRRCAAYGFDPSQAPPTLNTFS